MITYEYETTPESPEDEVERFEWRQGISEPALEHHPETGAPVRRVVTGGLGFTSSVGGRRREVAVVRDPAAASRAGRFPRQGRIAELRRVME